MQATGINTTIYRNGDTKDIINVVLRVYAENREQPKELSKRFTSSYAIIDQCERLFWFVYNNVKYREDVPGKQDVKTPARLLSDGVGDCKSMAIFIASCLHCMNVEHFFRFVSYSKGDYTHVYIVAKNEQGNTIYMDPVLRVAGKAKFNYELNYTTKQDIAMNGTKISYLAGVGTAPENIMLEAWTGGKATGELRVNEIELYAKLEELQSTANIAATAKEVNTIYNQMDIYYTIIKLIEKFGNDAKQLEKAGDILNATINEEWYKRAYTSLDERQAYTEGITAQIIELTEAGHIVEDKLINAQFSQWYKERVIAFNYYINPTTKEISATPFAGIGATYSEISAKIKTCGGFFLYGIGYENNNSKVATFPDIVREKRMKQIARMYEINNANPTHTIDAIRSLTRSGLQEAVGVSPEQAIYALKENKGKPSIGVDPITILGMGIGEFVTLVIGLITAITPIVLSLFSGTGINLDTLKNEAAADSDWKVTPKDNNTTSAGFGTGILPIALIGGLAAFLFSKTKTKTKSAE